MITQFKNEGDLYPVIFWSYDGNNKERFDCLKKPNDKLFIIWSDVDCRAMSKRARDYAKRHGFQVSAKTGMLDDKIVVLITRIS